MCPRSAESLRPVVPPRAESDCSRPTVCSYRSVNLPIVIAGRAAPSVSDKSKFGPPGWPKWFDIEFRCLALALDLHYTVPDSSLGGARGLTDAALLMRDATLRPQ